MTRRQIAWQTFVGTACLIVSIAIIKERGLSIFDGLGIVIGLFLLAFVANEVRK